MHRPTGSAEADRRALASAALFGAMVFLARFGLRPLDPTRLDWVMTGDWGQHVLGWLFFRRADWSFPIGSIPGLAHPVGTTIAWTDSLPLVAVPLKLVSPLLPEAFQFVGPWLLCCFVLQGVFGARLVAALGGAPVAQGLGGALFVLAPVLHYRIGHDSLCAHWILLAIMRLHLAPVATPPWRSTAITGGYAVLAAAVHPTLWAMAFVLALGLPIRDALRRSIPWRTALAIVGAMTAGSFGVLVSLGYFGSGIARGAGGFGYFSADLLTLVNPLGWSRVLPDLPAGKGQTEGLGYLGLGVILLGVAGGALGIRRVRPNRETTLRWGALVLATLALAVFALSKFVTFRSVLVVDLTRLYRPFVSVTEAFRGSGRFVWPMHYLVVVSAIALALRLPRPRGTVLLALALAIQLVDVPLKPVHTARGGAWLVLASTGWDDLAQGRRHLVVYPMPLRDGGARRCPDTATWPENFYLSAGWLAYRHGLTSNAAYLARMDEAHALETCAALDRHVMEGRLDPLALYVVHPSAREAFDRIAHARCTELDGVVGCVAGQDVGAAQLE